MEKLVLSYLKNNNLITEKTVICAVSGGADSVCLITILNKLGFKTVLAHVNHHKRLQSEEEQIAMQKLAHDLNVPFELLSYHYEGNDNFHNDSHNARYDFFRNLCHKYNTNIIATAHHSDDQIETILIKLMEGSNLYGYGGISVCNDDGEYKIIRPLLCVSKQDIYDYAKKENLIYFEDESNHQDDYLRNRLRHHVIPLLKKECPDLGTKANQYSTQVKEAFDYIRRQSIQYLDSNDNKIDIASFASLDIAIKKDIISLLMERFEIRKNTRIIESSLDLLSSNEGTKFIFLENNYKLVREYGCAYIQKDIDYIPKIEKLDLNNEIYYSNKYKFYFSKNLPVNNAKFIKLCYNTLVLPFTIRPKSNGDEINMPYGSKKVSRVLIDHKISQNERNYIPIIEDANGNILWIYNLEKSKAVYDQKANGDIYLICEEI